MKLLVLADIDDFHWRWEGGTADAVISCGDVADSLILEAAAAYRCSTVLAVKGNHDPSTPFPQPIIDLHCDTREADWLLFGGFNGCWKYKPRGHHLYDQTEVERLLANFPPVDVFVTHNSPRGVHERGDEVHTGFDAFASYLARHRPKLMVHGHQHVNQETDCGGARVLGVYGHRVVELSR